MKRKRIPIILLILILSLAVMSPAFAQDETPDPPESEETDDAETGEGEDDESIHPIVALFAAYYASVYVDDGSGEMPNFGEDIAAYHEDGVGFGVLANMTAIVAACQESETAEACPTLAQLVDEFKNGKGMGQLYKLYGKPDKHGVGFIKKETRCNDPDNPGPPGLCKDKSEKSNNGHSNGNSNKDKDKEKDK